MTRATTFSTVNAKRQFKAAVAFAREMGMQVDKMGVRVDKDGVSLLPAANANAFDVSLDAELEAIDRRGARGR